MYLPTFGTAYLSTPKDPITERQMMNPKGCIITETKRKVFRFHAPILSFGEPGSLGYLHLVDLYGKFTGQYPTLIFLGNIWESEDGFEIISRRVFFVHK